MTDDCGCCEGPPGLARGARVNRPGLPAIDYRLGTFTIFRQTLLDELSRTGELKRLRSRISDDYTISTVEMWSAVADVLTFYSERIANEAFIRTATSRDSVLRLVRLIDYHLAPGIAARTVLGFTLEPGAALTIPARIRVQSVPAQDHKPQKYETLEPLAADARLNRLRIYPAPVSLPKGPLVAGNATAIAAPDPQSVTGVAALAKGDRVLVYSPDTVEILTVAEVAANEDLLEVSWTTPVQSNTLDAAAGGAEPKNGAYKLGRTFRLFGTDTPESFAVNQQVGAATDGKVKAGTAATGFGLSGDESLGKGIGLDARYDIPSGQMILATGPKKADTTKSVAIPCVAQSAVPQSVSLTAVAAGEAADAAANPPKPAIAEVKVVAANGTATAVTVTSLADGFNTIDAADRRKITLYELLGPPVRFWRYDYPPTLTSETACLPGFRVGWSTIEVGRTIAKGKYKPGIRLSPKDFSVDRRVAIADTGGATPAVATITGAALSGSDVNITAESGDEDTLAKLGLGAAATATTALVSAPLPDKLTLSGTRELAVTIGSAPTQTIMFDLSTGDEINSIAAKLQQTIRAALPAEEGFALATVWADHVPSRTPPFDILVAAGVPGTEVRFAHTDNDDRTVATLGLDAAHSRFADGLLSGHLISQKITGNIQVHKGFEEPTKKPIDLQVKTPAEWAKQLSEDLELAVTAVGDRLLFMPRLPVPADREWLRITLSALPAALDRNTAYLLGNVTDASHGETVRDEILGDGNASVAFQQFNLTKKPLTVLSAPTPRGVDSSLQLFVNGEMWTEVPTLFGAPPTAHIFTTRTADDGATTVGFGDGVHGARPTTGRQNIVATYRNGSGISGRVAASALRTLLDRPTGVKAVTNPLPGEGGSDAESLDSARRSAPGSVRTFGRAVSLLDFEDATLTNREVAKARSQWVWAGHQRVVHLTVAAQGGETFTAAGLDRLRAQFFAERDPNRTLLIDNYVPVGITISGTVTVDARHITSTVLKAANDTLLQAFSFEQRGFAEPVFLSDVIAALQNVAGVAAVDIDTLDLKSSDHDFRHEHGIDDTLGHLQPRLLILPARWSPAHQTVLPAELAVIEVPVLDVTLRTNGGIPS